MNITDLIKRSDDGSPPESSAPSTDTPAVPPVERGVTVGELTQAVERGVQMMLNEGRKRARRRMLGFFMVLAVLAGLFLFGGGDGSVVVNDKPVVPPYVLPSGTGSAHVAILPIEGEINGDLQGPPVFANTTLYIHDALEMIEDKKNVAAVIFIITSPGGDAVASSDGYQLIKEFKERTKIPVYAYVPSFAYSGGYYLALGADKIIAGPAASLGNIGVIMRLRNFSRLSQLVGVTEEEISTGPRKNAGSSWRPLSVDDRAMMQREVDQSFTLFLGAMSESRKIPMETLVAESQEKFGRTSGAWFFSSDAVKLNMADKALTRHQFFDAVYAAVQAQHQWKTVEFISYDKRMGMLDRWKDGARKSLQEVLFGGPSGHTLRAE